MKQLAILFMCCAMAAYSQNASTPANTILIAATDFVAASTPITKEKNGIALAPETWVTYRVNVPQAGRYNIAIAATGGDTAAVWLEDYANNMDGRTYNITGTMRLGNTEWATVTGAPLDSGTHLIKVHAVGGPLFLKTLVLACIQPHLATTTVLQQNMQGSAWELVWADEFENTGLPDTSKWTYNEGNWGWGNNEPQYYTANRLENARVANGILHIEAHKNDLGHPWTSARLTTAGKQSFLYGKIEFRAKVPVGRGTWSAGWLLGADYRDEQSWPFCGEIDVLECVGFEIDDSTGNGRNHASCHTSAYYFKQNNQITASIPVENMQAAWHTYTVEWHPNAIHASVDGVRYYTYDKIANEREWPFNKPQNIILNLAVGGGWGGAKGIDENYNSHLLQLDYVRVYQATNTPQP